MRIDIVIPTCNRQDLITNTLRSLQANTVQDFQAWVIDQSDDTATAVIVQAMAAQDPRIMYMHSSVKGVNAARNLGIAAGTAPIVALTDDDCEVAETWLETLLVEYANYPECDSVFGRVLPVTIPETAVSPEAYQEISHLQEVLPMAVHESSARHVFGEDRLALDFGHGANMSFRRSAFIKFGLFDEYLGAGAPLKAWPERDMGYRILSGGGKILFSPDVLVFHLHWRTWKEVKKTFRNYAFGTGAAVGKYVRTGDWAALKLLMYWLWYMGVRQVFSGLLKWRCRHKIQVGISQLIYPWVGLWHSTRYAIDPHYCVYTGKKGQSQKTPVLEPPPVANDF